MTWAQHLLHFYKSLKPPGSLPKDIQWLFPQQDEEVMQVVEKFIFKYFNDDKRRRVIFGINPGRFGAGATGVNFTGSRQLKEICGIDHSLKMQSELSAEFIYAMIDAYGGVSEFYFNFFIGSVCTLGFIKGGKNINYYDDKELLKVVEPFIIETIEQQLAFPVIRDECFCLGGEKNFKYLQKLNEKFKWFEKVTPLPHPRFIMQYRRKYVKDFIKIYINALRNN